MASKYAVETVFKAVDAMTAPLKSMEGSMKSLGGVSAAVNSKIKNDLKSAEMQLNAFGKKIKNGAKLVAAAAVAAAGAALVDSTKKYIEFEDAITRAGSKFVDLDVTSEDFKENLEALQQAAMEVGSKTMFSAQDAAGALDKMAMAGLSSSQSIAMLMGTTNLAAAAGIDLTSAVDMATDALGAFNLTKDEFGNPLDEAGLAASVDRIADVVAKATNMANFDMNMWFESAKNGASTFTSLGGSLEEFTGMAAVLANAGIKGGEAGTALRNVMLNLSAPSTSAAKALETLGIQTYDSAGKMLPVMDILKQFEANLGNIDEETKNGALKDIFGTQNIGSFLKLLSAGTDQIEEYITTLENAGGTASNIAKAQQQSLKSQITLLKSAIEGIQLNIGKAVAENGGSAGLQKIIQMVNNINMDSVKNAIIGLMDLVAGAIQFFIGFAKVIWALRAPLIAIIGAITLYKATIMGTVIAMKAWNAIQVIIKAAQIAWISITQGAAAANAVLTSSLAAEAAATGTATAAQTGFNLAMLANPITWIVLGIIVLIAVIVALAMNWDKVTAALQTAWQWIKNVASAIWDGLCAAWQGFVNIVMALVLPAFNAIWQPISRIIEAFQGGGFIAGIKQIGVAILEFLLTPVQKLLGMLSKIPGIGGKFEGINDDISAWIDSMKYQGENTEVSNTAPVSNAERYSYSQNNNVNETRMTIGLEKGLTGQVSGPAPGITVKTASSGAF